MKKLSISLGLAVLALALFSFTMSEEKLVSKQVKIVFFSHTPLEDIEAVNNGAVGTIDTGTGDLVFSVPMQGFEFPIALMQKHFNSGKFLDTKGFPKAKLKAKITNLSEIDFSKDGTYKANVDGELTIKGVTNKVKINGTIKVSGKKVEVNSKFDITLSDYGISFAKGKPSTNVAKTLEVRIQAAY